MNDILFVTPILLGVVGLKKPGYFRHARWTEDSFIVIRGMGVALIIVGVALMIAKK